jgi:glucosamine--fructose-6-phosphate aminotransferase (isomerizing)
VDITPDGWRIETLSGEPVQRDTLAITWNAEQAERGGYAHFMLKEIFEQPQAATETLSGRLGDAGELGLEDVRFPDGFAKALDRIWITACGTALHAGYVGKELFERVLRIPTEAAYAHELRYADPLIAPGSLTIAISQSGETADTLAAMRSARRAGAKVLAVTNIVGSQATREADGVLFTRAGLEIGVAATKTFLAQVLAMHLLALYLGQVRGTVADDDLQALTEELRRVPTLLNSYLESSDVAGIERVAQAYAKKRFFLFLGRNIGLPVALEGALKLKEISYIPTESYAAGEMKHGPIALLEDGSPVVVVATDSHVFDKLASNIQEVKARGAHVIAVASEGNEHIVEIADEVFVVPRTDEMFSPLLAVVPLQLFAYYAAKANGESVDQPRNLAKTVTVE